MSSMVRMAHPDIAVPATTTQQAFDEVWEPLGWELVTPGDPIVTVYGASMRHRGNWGVGYHYYPGDVVDSDGSLYIALRSNLAVVPESSPADWSELIDTEVSVLADVDGGTP